MGTPTTTINTTSKNSNQSPVHIKTQDTNTTNTNSRLTPYIHKHHTTNQMEDIHLSSTHPWEIWHSTKILAKHTAEMNGITKQTDKEISTHLPYNCAVQYSTHSH